MLNRPNFQPPVRTVYAGTVNVQAPVANAGVIISTATSSRQIQFALKIPF
jgi:hypothetical protein